MIKNKSPLWGFFIADLWQLQHLFLRLWVGWFFVINWDSGFVLGSDWWDRIFFGHGCALFKELEF